MLAFHQEWLAGMRCASGCEHYLRHEQNAVPQHTPRQAYSTSL